MIFNEQKKTRSRVSVGGVGFDSVSSDEAVDIIVSEIRRRRGSKSGPFTVVTPNPLMLRKAETDPDFREILNSSDLVLADGIGVVGAARRQGTPLPGRVTGIGTGDDVAGRIAEESGSIFILGAKSGRSASAAERLCMKYPGLRNAGTADGYSDLDDTELVLSKIPSSEPDLLIVCLGAPAQEKWVRNNYGRLLGVGAVMCLGGAADVWSGSVRPAPPFVCKLRLEWMWRMLVEPRRISQLPELIAFRIATRKRLKKDS